MKTIKMQAGTVTTNEFSNFKIHTYTSPESGGLVNSHIIETSNHVILIDTQYVLPFAKELKEFVESIKKPIERIIISHAHPDHWFGNEFFQEQKIFALKEVRSTLEQAGDAMIKKYQHLNQNGPLVPTVKTLPNLTLPKGAFAVDDIAFHVIKFTDAEDSVISGIEIPTENLLIAQDIVYDSAHAFMGQSPDTQKNWIELLEKIKTREYSLVLGGHGIPSKGDNLTPAISYLQEASATIQKALSEDSEKKSKAQFYNQAMIEKYPTLKGQLLVQLSANYLFG